MRAGRAAVRLSKLSEIALRGAGLSPAQYRLMLYLSEGSAAAAALAERLIVTRPSVTTLVDGLVGRGLVERQADPQDRRRIDHLLTLEGRRVLAVADGAVADMIAGLVSHLSPDDAGRAVSCLTLVHDALDAALDDHALGAAVGSERDQPAGRA